MKLRSGTTYTAIQHRNLTPSNQLPQSLSIRPRARLLKKRWHSNTTLISKLSHPMTANSRDILLRNYEEHERQFNGGYRPVAIDDLDAGRIAEGMELALQEARTERWREKDVELGRMEMEEAYRRSKVGSVKSAGYGWRGWEDGFRIPPPAGILKRRRRKRGLERYIPEWARGESPPRELAPRMRRRNVMGNAGGGGK